MGSKNYLYQQILGLSSPWKVVDVRLVAEGQANHISVEHGSANRFRCPKCDSEYGCFD
jgi:transposase